MSFFGVVRAVPRPRQLMSCRRCRSALFGASRRAALEVGAAALSAGCGEGVSCLTRPRGALMPLIGTAKKNGLSRFLVSYWTLAHDNFATFFPIHTTRARVRAAVYGTILVQLSNHVFFPRSQQA